jgi:hypothetical protein
MNRTPPKTLKGQATRKSRSGGLQAWIASIPRVQNSFRQSQVIQNRALRYSQIHPTNDLPSHTIG